MRKLILLVHTSLDGYVAGLNGGFEDFKPSPENLDFVCGLTDNSDAALVGRVSYEMLESYWPKARENKKASPREVKYSNWYNDSRKIVISNSMTESKEKTTVISDNIAYRINEIKNQTGKSILMFGSPTTFETLNRLNLIDEYWIIQYPVLFGKGIPFFSRVQNLNRLRLMDIKQFTEGEIAINYKIG